MKTFAKITLFFFFGISFFIATPTAKAGSHTDEQKYLEMNVMGTNHINIGSVLNIELNSNIVGQADLTVENAAGQRFAATSLQLKDGNTRVKLNIAEIPAGAYFIKVVANGRTETTTFVVSHLNS